MPSGERERERVREREREREREKRERETETGRERMEVSYSSNYLGTMHSYQECSCVYMVDWKRKKNTTIMFEC